MRNIIVLDNPQKWKFDVPDAELVSARDYITNKEFASLRHARVFNLCRSYRYQSLGYYVSLLAEARGHKPLPSVLTLRDMLSQSLTKFVSEDLDDLIQKALTEAEGRQCEFEIYFGRSRNKFYDKLSYNLFSLFQAPIMNATFSINGDGKWHLQHITPVPLSEIPADHAEFLENAAREYFSGKRINIRKRTSSRYDLAILYNPEEADPPSNERALQKFIRAGEAMGFDVELITRADYERLGEFDALFIRETTYVNHYTYRFARRAEANGIVVIDDPESIVRCTNKVYHAELFRRHNIPTPKTLVVHRDNIAEIIPVVGLPCVLKPPDGAFSKGMKKVEHPEQLEHAVGEVLENSELILAQEFRPTDFDWRIGVLDNKPLYACKYHMAPNHWQIIKNSGTKGARFGKVETVPVELVPRRVVRTAVAAARLIGNGLYGIDMKEIGREALVMEINDNPNIDAGYEDSILKDELYTRILEVFLKRIEKMKRMAVER